MDSKLVLNKINRLREAKGMTKNQLCDMAGVSHSTLYNWVKRKTLPSFEILNALCEALSISLASLFLTDDKIENLSIEMKKLIDDYSFLNSVQQNAIRVTIEAFLAK